ncbi:hypothetical protein HDU93_003951 [Gonapodya sp. JEL0774]|nr:hypothetical protein HDU93_003951 [Gonapodya sp. JEL0774]
MPDSEQSTPSATPDDGKNVRAQKAEKYRKMFLRDVKRGKPGHPSQNKGKDQSGGMSASEIKKKIRDTERTMAKVSSFLDAGGGDGEGGSMQVQGAAESGHGRPPDLPPRTAQDLERRLRHLRIQLDRLERDRRYAAKEKEYGEKYKMVRFVERQKLTRTVHRLERQLASPATADAPSNKKDLEHQLEEARYYPTFLKYVSLFTPVGTPSPSTSTSAGTSSDSVSDRSDTDSDSDSDSDANADSAPDPSTPARPRRNPTRDPAFLLATVKQAIRALLPLSSSSSTSTAAAATPLQSASASVSKTVAAKGQVVFPNGWMVDRTFGSRVGEEVKRRIEASRVVKEGAVPKMNKKAESSGVKRDRAGKKEVEAQNHGTVDKAGKSEAAAPKATSIHAKEQQNVPPSGKLATTTSTTEPKPTSKPTSKPQKPKPAPFTTHTGLRAPPRAPSPSPPPTGAAVWEEDYFFAKPAGAGGDEHEDEKSEVKAPPPATRIGILGAGKRKREFSGPDSDGSSDDGKDEETGKRRAGAGSGRGRGKSRGAKIARGSFSGGRGEGGFAYGSAMSHSSTFVDREPATQKPSAMHMRFDGGSDDEGARSKRKAPRGGLADGVGKDNYGVAGASSSKSERDEEPEVGKFVRAVGGVGFGSRVGKKRNRKGGSGNGRGRGQ